MSKFPRIALVIAAVAMAASAVVAVTSASVKKASATADICVLLPDSKSSVRWETQDRPRLAAAFQALGDSYSIVNAEGSAQTQLTQAQQCLTNGAKVILLVNLDSGSGAAIEKLAKSKGAQSIDYDRLTLKGLSSYYVSFDNVKVGQLQGQGLINCMNASGLIKQKPVIAELNGAPTDNNAKLFAQGYNGVLANIYKNGTAIKGPNQSVPQWDNQKALTIFQGMLTQTNNKINAVLAANDGLGNAAITALKSAGFKANTVPVTGQDATAQGIQNIISGWQCMTVYKAVATEASAAATVADGVLKGKPVNTKGKVVNNGIRNVPSVLANPIALTKNNWNVVITDHYLKKSDICTGEYKQYC